MSSSPSKRWLRRLLAGASAATLVGLAAPIGAVGVASAAPAALASSQLGGATGTAPDSGGTTGGSTGGSTGGGSTGGTGSGGTGSGGTGSGGTGTGGGGAAQQQADAIAEQLRAQREAQERAEAEREAAEAQAEAERQAAEAAREAEEQRLKEEERARKAAEQAARAAAQARETWDRRGRPNKLIIIRQNNIDTITGGQLNNRTPRSGPITLGQLSQVVPASFLSVEGDTARLNAAIVLTTGAVFDISGVKTLQLGGGNSPSKASFLYTGSGRMTIKGVTVTAVDDDGQPLAANSPGRPYIVVAARGRFDATDSTLSDLGVQPIGADKGEPGISYNTDSTGALVRTSVLRNTTGIELSASRNVRLDAVTIAESWSDGLVLQADKGTRLSGVSAERNGATGVQVVGESTDRPITGITTSGNHSYGVVAAAQKNLVVRGITATGDGAGGLRINRCADCVIRDITTHDQPIGLFFHVFSTNATVENITVTGGRRGVVVEKTTKGLQLANSTIGGTRVAGVAIGGKDVTLNDVAVNDAQTAVRVERGAGHVGANRLKLSGGQDGLVTTAGTTDIVVTDLVTDGVGNDSIRNFSPGMKIQGGHINGGLTGIDVSAATTISGTRISLANEGIRARTSEPVAIDNVAVDAVAVGMNVAEGSPVLLNNSRVHALQAVRGVLSPEGVGNDLSLPTINLLGAIGVPLIILAFVLEGLHSARHRRYGGLRRRPAPRLPATA